jgi:hypothetical protein
MSTKIVMINKEEVLDLPPPPPPKEELEELEKKEKEEIEELEKKEKEKKEKKEITTEELKKQIEERQKKEEEERYQRKKKIDELLGKTSNSLSGNKIDRKTQIFVNSINPKLNNDFILKILETCGPVEEWKRVQDPNTNVYKSFGFCSYHSCEGAMKGMRNLDKLNLKGEILTITADKKTKNFIEVYVNKKLRMLSAKILDSKELLLAEPSKEAIEYLKEKEKEEDIIIQERLKELIYGGESDKERTIQDNSESEVQAVKNTIDKFKEKDGNTEEKTYLISESIRQFRIKEREREREKQQEEYNRQLLKEKEKEKMIEYENKKEKER